MTQLTISWLESERCLFNIQTLGFRTRSYDDLIYSEVPLESHDHAVVSVIFRLIPKHNKQTDWHRMAN